MNTSPDPKFIRASDIPLPSAEEMRAFQERERDKRERLLRVARELLALPAQRSVPDDEVKAAIERAGGSLCTDGFGWEFPTMTEDDAYALLELSPSPDADGRVWSEAQEDWIDPWPAWADWRDAFPTIGFFDEPADYPPMPETTPQITEMIAALTALDYSLYDLRQMTGREAWDILRATDPDDPRWQIERAHPALATILECAEQFRNERIGLTRGLIELIRKQQAEDAAEQKLAAEHAAELAERMAKGITIQGGLPAMARPMDERFAVAKLRSGRAYATQAKRLTYLCEPFALYTGITGVSAPRGLGKTFLALGLAKAVVERRQSYLGWPMRVRTGRVLLVLVDDAESIIGERLKTLGLDRDEVGVIGPDDWVGNPSAFLANLKDAAEAMGGVDLILVDAKYVFVRGETGAGNDTARANDLLEPLRRVAAQTGSAIMLIDHDNRAGGAMSGALAASQATYAIVRLTDPDDQGCTLFFDKLKTKPRDQWPSLRIRQNSTGAWEVTSSAAAFEAEQQREELIGKLRRIPAEEQTAGKTPDGWARTLESRKDDTRAFLAWLGEPEQDRIRMATGEKPRSGPAPTLWCIDPPFEPLAPRR